jgi:hypothetical protein
MADDLQVVTDQDVDFFGVPWRIDEDLDPYGTGALDRDLFALVSIR